MGNKKESNSGCFGNLIMYLVFFIFIGWAINSCSKLGKKDDTKYDNAYWRSIEREKAMRDAGLKDYADREKKERRNKLKGSGSSTYNGSQKQKDDLKEIDEYMKNNPGF